MSLISGLLGDFLPYIVGGLAALAALFGLRWQAKREGRQEVITEQRERALDNAETRRKIEEEEARRKPDDPGGSAADRLRDKYRRD